MVNKIFSVNQTKYNKTYISHTLAKVAVDRHRKPQKAKNSEKNHVKLIEKQRKYLVQRKNNKTNPQKFK